jgi:hypothetical protein
MTRRRWGSGTSDVVVVALLGFIFLMIGMHPMYHSNFWGRLKFGKCLSYYSRHDI